MNAIKPVLPPICNCLKVGVVIVLYRMRPWDSPSFRSVISSRDRLAPESGEVHILLWDNTPGTTDVSELPPQVRYVHDPTNPGLAAAYNHARNWASQLGSEWLLTLDQDTALPEDFFEKMARAVQRSTQYAGIGAIVPQIAAAGRQLSPNWFQFGAIPRWYRSGFTGVPREPVFAFNSAAMLRLSALQQIGGYDPRFWLDDSDAMIFSKLHQHGKRVYVAGDIQVDHEFSMKDMQRRMSPQRYENALFAETAFWDLRMSRAAGWERSIRLLIRMVKQWMRGDSEELRRITIQALERRFFTSRRRRIDEWKRATASRLSAESVPRNDTKISVCMAAYNGGSFVEAQLRSILSQLKPADEIVIVDDGSSDDTQVRIAAIGDSRIRLFRHEQNAGVVATFEDALRLATGDILFLSDDDDVWAPTKAQRFMEVFENRPDVEIVTSRVRMIDEHGKPLPDSRINRQGVFLPGFWRNLYKNHYQGSAMAIRASLLARVLPFPERGSFLHDVWIGTRNDAMGGKAVFIEEDLLLYRRHFANASRTKPLFEQIRTRIELLIAHLRFVLQSTLPSHSVDPDRVDATFTTRR